MFTEWCIQLSKGLKTPNKKCIRKQVSPSPVYICSICNKVCLDSVLLSKVMKIIVMNVTNVMSCSTGAVLTIPLMKHHQICGIVQHIFDYMELCLNLKCLVNIGTLLGQLGIFCRNNRSQTARIFGKKKKLIQYQSHFAIQLIRRS